MIDPPPGRSARLRAVPSEDPAELYEQAPCGYLSALPDDRIIKVNQTLLTWLGHDRAAVLGQMRLTDLLTTGSRIYYETHVRPTLNGRGSMWEVAVDLRAADGRPLPVLLNATLVRDRQGDPHMVRVSVFDARLRRKYEQELLRARQRAEASEARARELAQTLQASLLPPALPEVPGMQVAAAYRHAGDGAEVGGDFYDLIASPGGDWVWALGDVSGKGAAAAAVTGLTRYTLRAAAITDQPPAQMLRSVNEVLLRDPTERFCTAVCGRVRVLPDGRAQVRFVLGGQPQPLLVTPDGVQQVGRCGRLLGLFPDTAVHDTTVVLEQGHGLLAFTDGLHEARRDQIFLGEDGLRALVHERRTLPADQLVAQVTAAAVEFQDGLPRDDIAVLYLRVPHAS